MIEHQGVDARRAGTVKSGGIWFVRDDESDLSTERPGRGGIDERLKVAAAPGDQDADRPGSGIRDAGSVVGRITCQDSAPAFRPR